MTEAYGLRYKPSDGERPHSHDFTRQPNLVIQQDPKGEKEPEAYPLRVRRGFYRLENEAGDRFQPPPTAQDAQNGYPARS